ncbi:MAG: hypothetical protein EBS07_12235, partial [Sphingobacteriia bacterium]|nr:hypothetical protein [Sphingobacteriia bacterium]
MKRGGGGLDEEGMGIGLDNQGRAYIAGYMQGTQSVFDLNNLVSLGLITRLDSATVAQDPTPLSYCAGDSIIIPFTALADFQFGNVYTIELSDATGSFTSPITLGTWATTGSGSFHGVIPSNTPAGTGYRVRVNGTQPQANGRANTSNITIKALPALPIVSSNSPACIGTTLLLSATAVTGASWTWAGPNSFTSSVVTPIINPVSTIHAGTYSVFATVNGCVSPVATVTVSVTTVPGSITIGANGPICSGNTLQLTASNYTGVIYRWQGPNSFTANTQSVSRPGISLG